eukprot:CAMPEP_0168550410 /NCGR_PEP_ID=MMETSP0413-20121227/5623_1 /TAXON_ID=136452 /ORGANISM="Filamoeba nolandi, Strain NC-AS-23-1" /LENGTH=115 /DNA_ID=CAMNT_0008580865 /DNA_START=253 /DNA_END=597 /DNA_ORIENTATION=+
MRIYPLNPLLGRVAKIDVKLEDENQTTVIKKGTELIISCTAIQREGWQNPDTFDPSRFDRSATPAQGVFLPFGAGARACPASQFGLMAAQTVLIKVLSNLDVTVFEGFKHQRSLW